MLSPTSDTVRLVLHVLAAAVWVGGQVTLAGVVPTLRRVAPDATRPVARAFNRLAWPAFAVLVVTGMWSLVEVDVTATAPDYRATVLVKVTVSIVAGAAVAAHAVGRSTAVKAVGGALGALCSLGALVLGVLLRTGT